MIHSDPAPTSATQISGDKPRESSIDTKIEADVTIETVNDPVAVVSPAAKRKGSQRHKRCDQCRVPFLHDGMILLSGK